MKCWLGWGLDILSIKPRQKAGEKGVIFARSRFSDIHCEALFQKVWVDLQSQKNAQGYLGNQHKKENEYVLLSFLPILRRKSFVAILLCRNLNWNNLSFLRSTKKWQLIGVFPVHLFMWKNILLRQPLSLRRLFTREEVFLLTMIW